MLQFDPKDARDNREKLLPKRTYARRETAEAKLAPANTDKVEPNLHCDIKEIELPNLMKLLRLTCDPK
jgi:hypothetical protein